MGDWERSLSAGRCSMKILHFAFSRSSLCVSDCLFTLHNSFVYSCIRCFCVSSCSSSAPSLQEIKIERRRAEKQTKKIRKTKPLFVSTRFWRLWWCGWAWRIKAIVQQRWAPTLYEDLEPLAVRHISSLIEHHHRSEHRSIASVVLPDQVYLPRALNPNGQKNKSKSSTIFLAVTILLSRLSSSHPETREPCLVWCTIERFDSLGKSP